MGNQKSRISSITSKITIKNKVKAPVDAHLQSRIELRKGGRPSRYYKSTYKHVKIWRENKEYESGEVVIINATHADGWSVEEDIWVVEYEFWAMCMKKHKSNVNNKPRKDEIFNDLVINVIKSIKTCLIKYVKGFNNELSNIIVEYCYITNECWWNGCQTKQNTGQYFTDRTCGNLVTGLDSELCKICRSNIGLNGSVIELNKNNGKVSRVIKATNNQKCADQNEKTLLKKWFPKDEFTKEEKEPICNLLIRNFNGVMTDLIKCCIEGKKLFEYNRTNGSKHRVNVGDIHVWALYSKDNMLLTALVWRRVEGICKIEKWKNIAMFEVLFLSTSEHVRFEHYGYEMVKEIAEYCQMELYDVITVAAVPEHGERFWTKNGFTERWKSQKQNGKNGSGYKGSEEDIDAWIKQNMLVFDDTPLYAKNIT